MLKQSMLAIAFLLAGTMLTGCGDGGNTIVEQPDAEQMAAKKQEFAEFQQKMSEKSKLPTRP